MKQGAEDAFFPAERKIVSSGVDCEEGYDGTTIGPHERLRKIFGDESARDLKGVAAIIVSGDGG